MGAFEYIALDGGGRRTKGLLEGESLRHARQQLRDRGLVPVAVDAVTKQPKARRSTTRPGGRIGASQLTLLTRQLATLTASGLPLDDVLLAVSNQTEFAAVRRVVLGVRSRVLEGHSLAAGLEQFPGVFPDLYVTTVAAGEQTRHLPLVLDRLADHMEQRRELQQQVRLAMLYPAILTVTSILIVAGLLTYVVPEVVKVFTHMGQDLPALTRGLIAVSDALRDYGLALLAAAIGLSLFAKRLYRYPTVKAWGHRWLMRLPVIGRITGQGNAARFVRTLGILLQSGVAMVDALKISAKGLTLLPMQHAVDSASERVREGEALHRALQQTKRFPPLTAHLIASGEATGRLEHMLETAAQSHEREVKALVATLLGLLEPALILTMGGVVLTIVIAILLPIFELNQLF